MVFHTPFFCIINIQLSILNSPIRVFQLTSKRFITLFYVIEIKCFFNNKCTHLILKQVGAYYG